MIPSKAEERLFLSTVPGVLQDEQPPSALLHRCDRDMGIVANSVYKHTTGFISPGVQKAVQKPLPLWIFIFTADSLQNIEIKKK